MIATASPANHDFLRELGAEPLDYHDRGRPERVRELTDGGGADAAFDLFGGEAQEQAFATLRRGGRLVSIASPPPEPRDALETGYIFVRPSGYDLGEHITPLVHDGGRPAPPRRGDLPARAGRRGARAPRGRATCAASSSSTVD